MPTSAQLREQLAQFQSEYRNTADRRPWNDSGAGYSDFVRRQTDMSNQIQQMEAGDADAAAAGAKSRAEENRRQLYQGAEGRLSELRDDPVDRMLIESLTGRANGGDLPFNEATTNAMFTQRAQQSGAGESAAVSRLLARGMRPGDPAFDAALAEIQSGTQKANQNARLSVDSTATRENYDARSGAIGQLGALNAGRNSAITDQSRYLGGLREREQFREEVGGAEPAGAMPSFSDFRGLSGGGDPIPAPRPAPRPSPRPGTGGPAVAPKQPARKYNVGTQPFAQTSGSLATRGGTFGSTFGGTPTSTSSASAPRGVPTVTFRGVTTTPQMYAPAGPSIRPVPNMAPPPRVAVAPKPTAQPYAGKYRRTME